MYELRRMLFTPKRWLIFLLLAAVNFAFFSGYVRGREEQRIAAAEQRAADPYGQSEETDPDAEYDKYIAQVYPRFLETVQKQSKSQSILSGIREQSPFVTRNLEKTAKDYQKLGTVTVTHGENRGIEAAAAFPVTDYLLLLVPLLTVLELAAGLQSASGALERTTKRGRVPLTLWRIGGIAALSVFSVLILCGSNYLYSFWRFGDPGLLRSIQSIPMFQRCPFRVTIGGYILGSFVLKVLAVTVIALLCWVILARLQTIAAWGCAVLALAGSWLCWRFILPTFSFNHPKFLSVFAPLDADIFFTDYCNLNFFGYPVGIFAAMTVCMISLLAVLILLCVLLIGKCRPAKLGAGLTRFAEKIARKCSRFMRPKTLFGFEGWRLLIVQKGLFVLIAAALAGFFTFRDIRMWSAYDEVTERIYRKYSGPVTEVNLTEMKKYIDDLEYSLEVTRKNLAEAIAENASADRIRDLNIRIAEDENALNIYNEKLYEMQSLAAYRDTTGKDAWFIKPDSYRILLRQSGGSRRLSLILLLFIIFAFSASSAYDNRFDSTSLLRSTKRGRAGRRLRMHTWTAGMTLLTALSLHGLYLYCIIRDVGFHLPDAPAHSLTILRWLPVNCSMYAVIVLLFSMRTLIALLLTGAVMLISRFSRNPEKALLAALAVFLLPSALAESGIAQFQPLDFIGHLLAVPNESRIFG